MSYSPTDIHPPYAGQSSQPYGYENRQNELFRLTPEEERILKECSKEGVITRAIPMGILFGLSGFVCARMGPLMSTKYGVKPAVLGLAFLGYSMGRISYSSICMKRAMQQVPDGNLKKLFSQAQQPNKEAPDMYYETVETPEGQNINIPKQSSSMDIDSYSSTSAIDTVPFEYYQNNAEEAAVQAESKVYTSYDDLRRQNRQEHINKFYEPRPQVRYTPPVRSPEEEYPRNVYKQHTKYGDAWEV